MAYPPPVPQPAANVLRKSNALTRAGYSLSLSGHRLLGCALAALAIDETLFPRLVISSEMVKQAFPALGSQNAYNTLMRRTTQDAATMRVTLFDEGFTNLGIVPLFTRLDFIDGLFFFAFSPDIAPQVTELTRNYTSYTLKDVKEFKSEHQFRVHEIARSFLYQGTKDIPIEHLRRALGIDPDEYPSAGHFMARVIKPSIEAINKHTRLHVSAQPLKQLSSHKIYSVRFKVQEKNERELSSDARRLFINLQEFGVSYPRAIEIVTQYDASAIQQALESIRQRIAEGQHVSNPAGLLITKVCGPTRGAISSLDVLQPKWASQAMHAISLYKSASAEDRARIDRGFMAWATKPWQMFSYVEEFQTNGIDDPFITQLLALYILRHHRQAVADAATPFPFERVNFAAERAISQAIAAGQQDMFELTG